MERSRSRALQNAPRTSVTSPLATVRPTVRPRKYLNSSPLTSLRFRGHELPHLFLANLDILAQALLQTLVPSDARPIRLSPTWSHAADSATSYTLHQIAPYIGRMKASIARHLVNDWTAPGDLVVDPFCGCGTIAVEAAARGCAVMASDWNPYAVALTRAKLFAPLTLHHAEHQLRTIWSLSRKLLPNEDLAQTPTWVRSFFHPNTLRSALALRDACHTANNPFLLSCLLGILHHQRPGFLSYPASHLVPYLRDRKFPRITHPELYSERDVFSRLSRKLCRTYRRTPLPYSASRDVRLQDARTIRIAKPIAAVITSPPYMNELDYVRDNRLRLWFLERRIPAGIELTASDRIHAFTDLMTAVTTRLAPHVRAGGRFVIVLGDATRGRGDTGRTVDVTNHIFATEPALCQFKIEALLEDAIPDLRRSRRTCQGTKKETVLVYRSQGSSARRA